MTTVADIMRLIRARLNAIALGSYAKHAGQTELREALSLSVEQPGDMDPHGIYILEPIRTRTLDRQSRSGARVAEFALHLSSRLDPMIGEAATDLTEAWAMAERIGHVLETDLGALANVDVTSIAAQGASPDGATSAHLISFTATYEGG